MPGQGTGQLITVLGASGLLGTAISRELASRPVRLRLVGRRPVAVPPRPTAVIEERRADLTEPGAVAEAVAGSDVVIHLVAHISGSGTWRVSDGDTLAERVNLGLVHEVIDAIRAQRPARRPALLFAGSLSQSARVPAALAASGTQPHELLTAYDRHKLAAEQAIADATAEGLVRGSTLRLPTLYSLGTDPVDLDRGVVATMTRRAVEGQPLTMWHGGTAKRDLLGIDDAARAFTAALDALDAVAGRAWEIGTGEQTSVAELFAAIARTVSRQTGRPPVPVVDSTPAQHAMPTDQLDFVLRSPEFRNVTGWAPRVPLHEGLGRIAGAVARRHRAVTA
ncbi:Nucleoside-diphosphate-sugar epimerase [Streptomyces sp. 2224.1]|uniref:NAD-dependent epimerase/dehydratase family protein n=1 Tax=unclassified Streptomyces TaxID=2593676 RepID=UPI000882AF2C|nr:MULTISPECIES: NAD-dependent epimerase/dehydratase [unclassified Streptomyces]PBC83940.1 nucleoside-diphosphate-sugar epimerase [Streptomyces sp. 2321.6]SDR36907.1 Nucleoside-diphosphate-sugar epimerase [Streptomyces sp. KS_16]SEB87846.1 Nucleoside-diphosphate-sugar epimerase [Streptomyces sp. 2224.1]SED14242.1 Nucleoside-diphosphate-sugar epimerase [Streptomyces sp. 2133.1]SEE65177.1 Nucleoside-diphosphate-sugar epimerase [Streptomyces sp. 2112.3]